MALGVNYVQSNVAYYGVSGSGGNLPCAFLSNNTLGNIGLACFISFNGDGPSGVPTDGAGNNWFQLPGKGDTPFVLWYVCPVLKGSGSPVTVTIPGCTADANGGPVFIVMEYVPNPCPPGTVSINSFQAIDTPSIFRVPDIQTQTSWNASSGPFYHTLIAVIIDNANGFSATLRTWGVSSSPTGEIATAVRISFQEPSGTNNGCVADCVVGYPYEANNLTFTFAPALPAFDPGETSIVGLVIGSES